MLLVEGLSTLSIVRERNEEVHGYTLVLYILNYVMKRKRSIKPVFLKKKKKYLSKPKTCQEQVIGLQKFVMISVEPYQQNLPFSWFPLFVFPLVSDTLPIYVKFHLCTFM